MKCPQCNADMISAKATDFGEEYFYCKSCKKELKELLILQNVRPERIIDVISTPLKLPLLCDICTQMGIKVLD